MFDNLRADTRRLREIKTKPFPWYVLESLLFETGYQAVVLHRLAHWFRSRGIPVFGPALARYNQFLTGVDIAPQAVIGPGLRIAHGTGIVVSTGPLSVPLFLFYDGTRKRAAAKGEGLGTGAPFDRLHT